MAEKRKLSRAGKAAAVLGLIFAGTGAGYYFGTGVENDPFRQLTTSFQSAAQQAIDAQAEDARQAAFTKKTCADIDDALDKVFQAAGANNDFSTVLTPREGRKDICRIMLRGEEIFTFNHTTHFDPESHPGNKKDIEVFMEKSLKGMSYDQLVKLQETLPSFLKEIAP